MQAYKQEFIHFLVRSHALKFGDFTLKSGRKCPYFLNLGQFYKGSLISQLGKYYARALQENVADFDIVFGPAYKGIPLSTAIVMALFQEFNVDKAYSFNRKEAKDHGEGGMIVGAPIDAHSKIVIVDDVMTAGTALRETMMLLATLGNPKVQGVLIAVDRMERGQGEKSAVWEMRDEFGVPVYALVSLDDILEVLYHKEVEGKVYIDDEKYQRILEYRKAYGAN